MHKLNEFGNAKETSVSMFSDEADRMAVKEDGHFYLKERNGTIYTLPSKARAIAEDLLEYSNTYSDDEIELVNETLLNQIFINVKYGKSGCNAYKKQRITSGYVYLLKCADRYKIGYSQDVTRRIMQLDTRPFKLELLYKFYDNKAYFIEQELHRRLSDYRVKDEWYDFQKDYEMPDELVQGFIQNLIDEIKEDFEECNMH